MTKEENIEKLNSFVNLEENWDGYDASTIRPICIELARTFIESVDVQPCIAPLVDGGVIIEAYTGKANYFEITIMPDPLIIGEFKEEWETDEKFIQDEKNELTLKEAINDYNDFMKKWYAK